MTDLINNLSSTFHSPMVLCFALGILASLIRSDLKIAPEVYQALTVYLLLAIGLKGGVKISEASIADFIKPAITAVLLGMAIPVSSFFVLKRIGKFGIEDSAAIAAHYGSVSAVTFGEALSRLDNLGIAYEGFLPALLAILEIPGILVALFLAKMALKKSANDESTSWKKLFHDLLTGKGILLLLGGLFIGYLTGPKGFAQVQPFFESPFRGVLALFLLEVGMVAGKKMKDILRAGPFLIIYGTLFPVAHGIIGVTLGYLIGMQPGGAFIMGVLAASASYIAAPAAVRIALPQANPGFYLTASLAITFPFNLALGLPIYLSFAKYLYGNNL